MNAKTLEAVNQAIQAITVLKEPKHLKFIEEASLCLANCFLQGNKVLIAGNGGSLCDAMHFAEELTGNFRKLRRALPALALSDPGHITCVGNDMGFDKIFSRGVEAYGKEGDLFIGLSTSGNSLNMINAFNEAARLKLKTIAFLGKNGGKLKGIADLELCIEGFTTSDRIQEAHMSAIHIIIEQVEQHLFPSLTHASSLKSHV